MKSILIKNAELVVTMDANRRILKNASIYIENEKIVKVGPSKEIDYSANEVIDASGMIVLPGLINTHHHLYQTLTRCIPKVQSSELFDWLINLYEIWNRIGPKEVYISALTGMAELLLSGCTTTSDFLYVFPEGMNKLIDEEIKAAKEIGIRFYPCRGSMSLGRSKGGLPPDEIVQDEDEILKDSERLIREYHDPSKYSMLRIALAPYSIFSVTIDLMEEIRKLAKKYKVLCHTHLAETLDEEQYCLKNYGKKPLEFLESLNWLGEDVWIANAIYLDDEEIKKLAKTKTGVSYCPTSNMRLGSGIAPIKEMMDQGVKVSIGVDGSASNDSSNMLAEIRMAMLLQRVRYGAKAMTALKALELGTLGGAKVLKRDDIGSIEPGKAADIIGINLKRINYAGALHDPVSAIVFCFSDKVDFSIINGKIIVKNGNLVTKPLSEIIDLHNELSLKLVRI